MADVEIKGKVSVDTGGAVKSTTELNNEIKASKKALDDAKIGSDEYKAAQAQLKAQQDQLTKSTAAANEENTKNAGSFNKLKDSVGAVSPAMGGAIQGTNGLSTAFKALLANPIGLVLLAIVGALKLLYEWFANSFEGGQKLEQVFAGIKAAGQALMDSLGNVASAIKKVFTLDFSGAVAEIKGVAKAAGDAYNAMAKLTEQAQALKKEQLANDLDGAKRAKELAILREQSTDDTVPLAKRREALQQLKKDAEENAKGDIELAKKVTDNRIAQLTLQKDGALKNQEEITKLKIDQINVETDNANELRRINKQITAVDRQEAAERKAIQDEQKARDKENAALRKQYDEEKLARLKKLQQAEELAAKLERDRKIKEAAEIKAEIDKANKEQLAAERAEEKRLADNEKTRLQNKKKLAELDLLNNPDNIDNKIAKINADLALELSALDQADLQRQVLAKKASDAIVAIRKEETEAKIALTEVERQNAIAFANSSANALGAVANAIGKNAVAGKAISIAQALVNTYQGIAAGVKLGYPMAIPAVIAAAATGFAAVKSIVAVKVPGGAGMGSTPSIPSPASVVAPLAPTATTTSLNQASINGIGNAAQGGINRAFVLDSDVNNASERNQRINRAARLS